MRPCCTANQPFPNIWSGLVLPHVLSSVHSRTAANLSLHIWSVLEKDEKYLKDSTVSDASLLPPSLQPSEVNVALPDEPQEVQEEMVQVVEEVQLTAGGEKGRRVVVAGRGLPYSGLQPRQQRHRVKTVLDHLEADTGPEEGVAKRLASRGSITSSEEAEGPDEDTRNLMCANLYSRMSGREYNI